MLQFIIFEFAGGEPTAEADEPTTGMFIWTRAMTLLLIDQYKSRINMVNTGKLRKKALWKQIAGQLVNHGHNVTGAQCEGRWKTLIRGLKNVCDHNQKSGNNPRTHPFQNELAFIAEKPNVCMSYVVSSAVKPTASITIPTANKESDTDAINKESDTDSDNPLPKLHKRPVENIVQAPKKRRRTNEVVDVLKDFMVTQQERYEDDTKRKDLMHRDKMEIWGGLVHLLKKDKDENK